MNVVINGKVLVSACVIAEATEDLLVGPVWEGGAMREQGPPFRGLLDLNVNSGCGPGTGRGTRAPAAAHVLEVR